MNLVEHDAREFGLHLKQGGWRLGLLVARSVQKGKGEGGAPNRHRNDRYGGGKVSAQEFARTAGTSAPRVLRFLKAWEKAAAEEIVPPAADLKPGGEIDLDADRLPPWSDFYDASGAGGYNGGKERVPTAQSVADVIEKASPEAIKEAIADASPDTLHKVFWAAEREGVKRTEEANERQRAKRIEHLKRNPTEALIYFVASLSRGRAVARSIARGYEDFLALVVEDEYEDIRDTAREELLSYQTDVNLGIGEALEGSFDEAIQRLMDGED